MTMADSTRARVAGVVDAESHAVGIQPRRLLSDGRPARRIRRLRPEQHPLADTQRRCRFRIVGCRPVRARDRAPPLFLAGARPFQGEVRRAPGSARWLRDPGTHAPRLRLCRRLDCDGPARMGGLPKRPRAREPGRGFERVLYVARRRPYPGDRDEPVAEPGCAACRAQSPWSTAHRITRAWSSWLFASSSRWSSSGRCSGCSSARSTRKAAPASREPRDGIIIPP